MSQLNIWQRPRKLQVSHSSTKGIFSRRTRCFRQQSGYFQHSLPAFPLPLSLGLIDQSDHAAPDAPQSLANIPSTQFCSPPIQSTHPSNTLDSQPIKIIQSQSRTTARWSDDFRPEHGVFPSTQVEVPVGVRHEDRLCSICYAAWSQST